MKKYISLFVLSFLILNFSIVPDYSGTYDDDLFIGSPSYEYNVSFDFSFDNPSCSISNFSYSSLSIVAITSGITVLDVLNASYNTSNDTFSIVFLIDNGNAEKLVSLDLGIDAIVTNSGIADPGLCY